MGRVVKVMGRGLQEFGNSKEGQKYRQGVVENKTEEIAQYLQICVTMLKSQRRMNFEQKSELDKHFRYITLVHIKAAFNGKKMEARNQLLYFRQKVENQLSVCRDEKKKNLKTHIFRKYMRSLW